MDNIEQNSTGNNNLQVGVNNGQIIKTERIIRKIEIIHDKTDCITPVQALEIRTKVTEIGSALALNKKITNQKAYGSVYSTLYKKFGIHKYDLLPKDKFDEALKWLQKEYAIYAMPVLRKEDEETWRKNKYTSINTKYRQLGMTKEEFYIFANEVLGLKKPFSSITELSKTSLEKLYKKIWAKTKK
ncbi:ORF6C domain-containing protein [Riemerella anatipestifer]|nr:ORF6C domain-containing protein [Riemerella anatipestifer]